jgi:hypothetical protein
MDRDCAGTRLMSDSMLMADLTVNFSNNLPGGAMLQAATMDDVFGTTLADGGKPNDTLAEYAGFDRFGRVIDQLWYAYGASADRDRYRYGYNRASNRLYRENMLTKGRD